MPLCSSLCSSKRSLKCAKRVCICNKAALCRLYSITYSVSAGMLRRRVSGTGATGGPQTATESAVKFISGVFTFVVTCGIMYQQVGLRIEAYGFFFLLGRLWPVCVAFYEGILRFNAVSGGVRWLWSAQHCLQCSAYVCKRSAS